MAKRKKEKNEEAQMKKSVKRYPSHINYYTIGAKTGWTEYDFRMHFYNDILPDEENNIAILNEVSIIMSPRVLKELTTLLQKQLMEYEEANGIIDLEQKKEEE